MKKINWLSSEDEKNVRKINFNNLEKIICLAQNSENDMVKYVCELFDEYKELINSNPELVNQTLMKIFKNNFVTDGKLEESSLILSSSDKNAYYIIKALNKEKKDLTIICFDMHSDTYDYNEPLWKGNSFSKLLHEDYINHYVVIGVPEHRRKIVLNDTNHELLDRVHLINEDNLISTIKLIAPENIYFSIDVDCYNSRKAKYTAIEYSPATILTHVSHIKKIYMPTLNAQIKACIHVKNSLGYSNYYHTGENDLTIENVIMLIQKLIDFCKKENISVGIKGNYPYLQIMEVNGYDYGNLTSEMVVKLVHKFSKQRR